MDNDQLAQPKTDTPQERFDIHASVVFQLGESLISDPVQALLELVKNSYDADASYCKLTVSTAPISDEHSPFRGAIGSITVEDDGVGMTLEDIRRGWLTISNSEKRGLKEKALTTKKGRTPLGDKGLGRLGTQRLGDNLEMFTRPKENPVEQHVWFSWKDFLGQQRLSDVDVHRREEAPASPPGTKLIISGLREINVWQGDGVRELETHLSEIISPYEEVRNFIVFAVVDGKHLNLIEIGERLRETSQVRYSLNFDGELYTIIGKARLAYIRPDREPDKSVFAELVDVDQGESFFQFLQQTKRAPQFGMKRLGVDGWFVEYRRIEYFSEYDKVELIGGVPANPGPFKGEIDFFSQGADVAAAQNVFDTASEYRRIISRLSGIKVFRDGFGIRVSSDWLNLGKQWTSGKSYYTLKPDNTLGYIAISARENRQLEETTDREGFKRNAYYNNFYELMQSFVTFSESAQSFLRRGWLDFRKSVRRTLAQVSEDTRPEAISSKISHTLSMAASHKSVLSKAMLRLQNSINQSRSAIEATLNNQSSDEKFEALRQALAELSEAIFHAEQVNKQVEQYLAEISAMETASTVLVDQIETLREQIQQVHEIIALGLTAEALSHEINNIVTQLAQRNQQLVRHLRANAIKDTKIATFTEYVNTSIAGLRRQLLFLAPSLQYVRENKEVIDIEAFIGDLQKHYTVHFHSSQIGILPKMEKRQNFKVNINKGKLVQILDNLFLNSEYWLKEDIRRHRIAVGTITLEASKPYLRVSDNGLGVEPSLESSLFEPFVSAKGKGKGRGLGLYIVQQLLQAEGCSIRLLPKRNAHGRLFVFEIDLTGVLLDKR